MAAAGDVAARSIASDSSNRNAASADSAATGSDAIRIERQTAASSIQAGSSRNRTTPAPTKLHRARAPFAPSISSWMQTGRPAQGCQA